MQPASKQVGTAHTHESACRRSYSSTPDGCAVHAVLCLRVLLVSDVYTHVSTAVCVVSDLGFYTSRRDRTHTSSRRNRLRARLAVGPCTYHAPDSPQLHPFPDLLGLRKTYMICCGPFFVADRKIRHTLKWKCSCCTMQLSFVVQRADRKKIFFSQAVLGMPRAKKTFVL